MSFPMQFKKGSQAQVGRHFRAYEFDCPCPHCDETKIDLDGVKLLDRTRELLDAPVQITSGYRCDRYQQELKLRGYETAKGLSTHQVGKGWDLTTGKHTGLEIEKAARKAGFRAVGVGRTFAHVDTRSDKDRRWGYSVRS